MCWHHNSKETSDFARKAYSESKFLSYYCRISPAVYIHWIHSWYRCRLCFCIPQTLLFSHFTPSLSAFIKLCSPRPLNLKKKNPKLVCVYQTGIKSIWILEVLGSGFLHVTTKIDGCNL